MPKIPTPVVPKAVPTPAPDPKDSASRQAMEEKIKESLRDLETKPEPAPAAGAPVPGLAIESEPPPPPQPEQITAWRTEVLQEIGEHHKERLPEPPESVESTEPLIPFKSAAPLAPKPEIQVKPLVEPIVKKEEKIIPPEPKPLLPKPEVKPPTPTPVVPRAAPEPLPKPISKPEPTSAPIPTPTAPPKPTTPVQPVKLTPQPTLIKPTPTKPTVSWRERLKLTEIVFGFATVLVAGLVLLAYIGFYSFRLDRVFTQVSQYVPWPVVGYVSGHFISWPEYNNNLKALSKFYESELARANQPTGAAELEAAVFKRLVEDTIVAKQLKNLKVEVANDLRQNELKRLAESFGSTDDLGRFLEQRYGWNLAAFNRYLFGPYLNRLALEQALGQDKAALAQAKQRTLTLRQRVIENQLTFAEAAQDFSEDATTAKSGGDLGWIAEDGLTPELKAALQNLKTGEISQPILIQPGYHLLRLEERNKAEGTLHVSHILIRVIDFNRWLQEQVNQATVIKFLRIGS